MTTLPPDNALSLRELLALAASAGHPVTERQLKGWCRRGLLPRPQQRHPNGLKGSASEWPSGTDSQLLALCELHRRYRNLGDLLLAMWWEGWPVKDRSLLEELDKRLTTLPVAREQDLGATNEERIEAIEKLITETDLTRMQGPLRHVFRRIGRNAADRREFAVAVMEIGTGIMPLLEVVDVGLQERSLLDILATGFGFDGFAHQLTAVGDPTSVEDLTVDLESLAANVSSMTRHLRDVIAAEDIDRLNVARDDARRFAQVKELATSGAVPDSDEGIWYMGQVMTSDEPEGWVQMVMIFLWRRHQYPDAVERVVSSLDGAAEVASLFRAVPELAGMLAAVDGDWDALNATIATRPDLIEQIQAAATLISDSASEAPEPS